MPDILAAGVVVFRPGREVLLVHRPKYDDWSFPKGKLDRGEHPVAAAVREVAEETGVHVRLGPALPSQRYPVARRMKTVHYWTGRVVGDEHALGAHELRGSRRQVHHIPLSKKLLGPLLIEDNAAIETGSDLRLGLKRSRQ